MKLPNAHLAIVEREKVVGYLLNTTHPFGASKARFFAALGFSADAWDVLAEALRDHGMQHDVGKTKETGFGLRYEVDGDLETPDGLRPRIRTVWQIEYPGGAPRLITAYPLEAS